MHTKIIYTNNHTIYTIIKIYFKAYILLYLSRFEKEENNLWSKTRENTFHAKKVLTWWEGSYLKVQFSSVAQSCLNSSRPHDYSTPGFPAHHQLPKLTQTHVHWVGDAIQPSLFLLSPSPPTFNLSQHLGLFKWIRSLHQVAKILEFQLQHQSFQWIFRTNFL